MKSSLLSAESSDSFCKDEDDFERNLCEETTKEIDEAIVKLRILYDAGTALFTKENIRDLSRQLRAQDKKLLIRRVDGTVDEIEVRPVETYSSEDSDVEEVSQAPCIDYRDITYLTRSKYLFRPEQVFESLSICYPIERRDRITKKPINTRNGRSPEEVTQCLRTVRQEWEACDDFQQLKSILDTASKPPVITKIVAFACGSMSWVYSEQKDYDRVSFQHALALSLKDILTQNTEVQVHFACYAQDPAYTDIDKSVLRDSGIIVLDDPDGFLEVDDSTIVLSFSPNVPVKQIVSDIAHPAIMIWNTIEEEDDDVAKTDPDCPRLRKFIDDFYNVINFPGSSEDFGDLTMYIRRSTTSPIEDRSDSF